MAIAIWGLSLIETYSAQVTERCTEQEQELDVVVGDTEAAAVRRQTPFEQLAARNVFGADLDPHDPASGRRRRLPGFLLRFLHGRDVSFDSNFDRLMTYDTVTGMPTFVYLVLRRLFPRWTSERMERYLGDTRHLGSHDLEDTLFYCTLSREMFDLLRSILHVHFSTRYFTDIPEPISFDRDEEPGDEELAIDGLAGPHQVNALRSAVAAEYNDSASQMAHYPGLSKAGCLQILQWLIRNRFDRLHHILQSDDSQPALRDLIRSNRLSPALLEIEWHVSLFPCAVLCCA